MTGQRRAGRVLAWAIGTIIVTFVACGLAVGVADRLDVIAPRQATVRESVEQSKLNGDHLCDFSVATADALAALAGPDLPPDQLAAIKNMQAVAHRCQQEQIP